MKNFPALLAIVSVMLVLGSVAVGGTSWLGMANCVRSRLGFDIVTNSAVRCAIGKMLSQYRKMRSVSCTNCDKYFHCQGNYNAVHSCVGAAARTAAAAIR